MVEIPPSNSGTQSRGSSVEHGTPWYQHAVFYEVMVRSFFDSDGDGFGDFQGLVQKLDYLQWLGVDALWLPPFYASPLKDGGYDVSDYRSVLDRYGTVDDFRLLVQEIHRRGLRVVIDLVVNHTSIEHEWFQSSRSDPDGPYGDYYVWRDTDEGFPNVRIIFTDTEESNWAFDNVRRQFYFHRFFSHQADLNFANLRVQEEILDVARFWLDMGVDGFRLDAVPYLFESEEGTGESEPETHEFLRRLRAMIDRDYPGRVLLAEANQSPREVAAFFGTEENPECHMAFDFPVMPRIFYAMRARAVSSLEAVLRESTQIPHGASWGLFLRNHDELSLEMVTEEEREALYQWYAPDPRMRVNVGIRRRLAPLLENNPAHIELAHALLLSLKGTPFLYYGDEVGMGDNIWLDDRDASRTPMQWTSGLNAGFSEADPGLLYLPVVQSLDNDYRRVNVAAQVADSDSLLQRIRRLLSVRRAHPVFATGSLVLCEADNAGVLAFIRDDRSNAPLGTSGGSVLCVFSFLDTAQEVTLRLPEEFSSARVVDLFSGGARGSVSEGRVTMALKERGFSWCGLTPPSE